MIVVPQVSVIVPVFNSGDKLLPTIESLVAQSLKEIEIVIVNDASTDNTAEVVDTIAARYGNVVAIHLDVNLGVHEARLEGLRNSSAPWIGFLDSDDFARTNMFEKLLTTALDNNVDIVVCGSDRVTPGRRFIAPKLRFSRSKKISSDVFERFCGFEFGTGMLWNKLFRRSVIEPWFDLHFPWRQSINEDLLLNIGCFYQAESIYLLRDVLHEYVFVDSSVTSTMEESWAYVETFRAYVLAVICYQHLGERALLNIIEMYRIQIGWANYQVDNIGKLKPHNDRLHEAIHLLYQENFDALSAIIARPKLLTVGIRVALRSVYFAVVKVLRYFFRY